MKTAFAVLLLTAGCAEAGTNAPPPSPPDYAVRASYLTDGPLDDLSTVVLRVGVKNVGGGAKEATFLSMYVDSVFVEGVALGALASGVDTVLAFEWEAEPGSHAIQFRVERVAPAATFGAEPDLTNNAATLSLNVPTRERRMTRQAWGSSVEFLASVRGDASVQEVLALAQDSGFVILPSARTLETRFDGEGVTTFITPMGDPDALATSAPLLIVIKYPMERGGVVTIPYLFQRVDGTTYLVYNAKGGTRVSRSGDSTEAFTYSTASTGPRANAAATGECQEDTSICAQAFAARDLCAVFKANPSAERTLEEETLMVAACRYAPGALEACGRALVDDPPTIKVSIGTNGTGECAHCQGTTLNKWMYFGWVASANDDRGFTWNSATIFEATCDGGSFTFKVTDCGGQIATVSVSAHRLDLDPVPNWPNCNHQGKSSSLFLPGSATPLLGWRSPLQQDCERLPSRFDDDRAV